MAANNGIFTSSEAITGSSYTDQNIKDLQAKVDQYNQTLKNFNTNQATDEELRHRAESEYTPIYNANVAEQEALKQSAGTTLNQQLSALQRQYARNQETIGRNYDQQRVTANNAMLARGLNNSSLALAMLNRVEDQRNRAMNDLTAEHTASETAAQNAYSNTVSAADAALARLKSDLAMNVDARFQALRDAEQSRVMTAQQAQNQLTQYLTQLQLEIEKMRQNAYAQYMNQQQLMQEYGKGSSSSSSGSKGSSTKPQSKSSSLEDKYNSSKSKVDQIVPALTGVLSAGQLTGTANGVGKTPTISEIMAKAPEASKAYNSYNALKR